jgi:hypothetical protein
LSPPFFFNEPPWQLAVIDTPHGTQIPRYDRYPIPAAYPRPTTYSDTQWSTIPSPSDVLGGGNTRGDCKRTPKRYVTVSRKRYVTVSRFIESLIPPSVQPKPMDPRLAPQGVPSGHTPSQPGPGPQNIYPHGPPLGHPSAGVPLLDARLQPQPANYAQQVDMRNNVKVNRTCRYRQASLLR